MTANSQFDVFHCDLGSASLIEASAGTGKTWNICGLYMRLLLERGLSVQDILVVTFTNAATAELRERIRARIVETREYLDGKFKPTGDPFVANLIVALKKNPKLDPARMKEQLELALQTFDEASIFTIHGFCQRALADTAFAAGQAFALDLIPDDTDLRMEAVHDFWRRHIAGEQLSTGLAAYLLQKKDTPVKFATLLKRQLVKPLAQSLWPEEKTSAIDNAALTDAYAAAKVKWKSNRDGIIDLLNASLGILHKSSYKETSIREAAADYDDFFATNDPLAGKVSDLKLHLLSSSFLEARTTDKKKNTPPQHEFFDLVETMLAERENVEHALARARLQLIRNMLREAEASIRQRKQEQRLLSYDDILYNVFAALKSGDYPWLAQSLRQRFPAALIDEFQDTDPLQFFVFDTIYGDGNNPLFLVGDPKQAIYRFRNADLDTYLKARENAKAIFSISDNQRSTQGLIDGLNALFSANPQAFMLPGLDFQPVGFGNKPRKIFTDHSGSNADLQLWMLPEEKGEPIQRKQAMAAAAQATAAEIARLLNAAQDKTILIEDQPLQAEDIAVLVRTHTQGSAIRQALATLNIGSVELSQASVFASIDAEEIERVLTAIWSPARTSLLRAALATELIGCDANEIEILSANEAELMSRIHKFASYRDIWLQRGIGFLYRQLLKEEQVSARMLRRPDGERRMTNLLHLGELLHQAAGAHASPDALLHWLQTQRQESGTDEAAQLRLESDQNLVKILTIHKSKGLEYPVVFCPFLWDGFRRSGSRMEGREYHDETGNTIINFRDDADGAIDARINLESVAEDLRLIYVALTRAVYRCYLIGGCYSRTYFSKSSASESTRSLLNWLAAGNGYTPTEWRDLRKSKQTPNEIEQAWQNLAASSHNAIQIAKLPQGKGTPVATLNDAMDHLASQPTPKRIPSGWHISSYSGLSRGATHENASSDHDAQLPALSSSEGAPFVELRDDDILRFPKGTNAGECIHKAFELCDFTDPSGWAIAVGRALSEHPQQAQTKELPLSAIMQRMLKDVLNTPLPDGIRLCNVSQNRRLTELGFYLSSASLSAVKFNQILKELGYDIPRLHFNDLSCYLKGFIDLVFESNGRYYILDWKSNYLGDTLPDYGEQNVAEAMDSNGYHLQYLLYSVALNRYLAQRVRNYDYDAHFGGVLYLFVRGVRPDWKNADDTPSGVYFERPAKGGIDQLDAFFSSPSAKAA